MGATSRLDPQGTKLLDNYVEQKLIPTQMLRLKAIIDNEGQPLQLKKYE